MTPREPTIFWDVIEEHLDEAEFLWGQWERGLDAPNLSLDELGERDEERLLAHVDGLVVAGPPAAARLLLPALDHPEPDRAAAAAFALTTSGEGGLDAVLAAVTRVPAARHAPLLRALSLSERPEIDARLGPWLGAEAPELRAAALSILAFHGVEPGRALGKIRADDAPALVQAGVVAARNGRSRALQQLAGEAITSPAPALRDEAIRTGLILGFSAAWEACRRLVTSGDPSSAGLLSLAAMVGGAAERQAVHEALTVPSLERAAIEALAHAGTVAAAEACLVRLADPRFAPLAGAAFWTITGLPLRVPLVSRRGREIDGDPPDADLARLSREATFPRLDPPSVEAWWADNGARFDPEARYLFGEPLRIDTSLAALRRGPMSRRGSLALEVAIRSRGRHTVETRAFTARQRTELGRLRTIPSMDFTRPFE